MIKNIGKWKISSIRTGKFRLDGGAMMGSVPKVLWEKTNPADEYNRIQLSLRCLLADDGENVVLVESGMGNKIDADFKEMFDVQQSDFPLKDALSENGYSPGDITHVILTHLHFDHAGGATILENGELKPTFPNADYYFSERNWQAGLTPNLRDRASYLHENFKPLMDSRRLKLVPDNSSILPGISTLSVDGHTTGQQLIIISDAAEKLVFCADLIPLVSHLKLPWIMGYDLNAALTLTEKMDFLAKAAKENWWLWFYHDPDVAAIKIEKGEKYYSPTAMVMDE